MEKGELKQLLLKYSAGNCTKQEQEWVEKWYIEQDTDQALPLSEQEFSDRIDFIYSSLPKKYPSKLAQYWPKVAAVLSFLVLSIALYSYLASDRLRPADANLSATVIDIQPGGNMATLTLSDGTVLPLDQIKEGEVYQNKHLSFRKNKDGEIEYLAPTSPLNESKAVAFNQINTPNGGQYQITLPDGTKVWLNSASTLKYPTHFLSTERVVELVGEAYFEVAKSSIPFFVNTKSQRIHVLGTHFNVQAYPNEMETKTTLLEGSVKLSALDEQKEWNQSVILKPGEEALFINDQSIQVSKVNANQAVAWKNGYFHFEGDDLKSVMREFSRWYGVDVVFEGQVPDTKLWGEINRNVPASKALGILKYYELNFTLVQRKGVSKIEISN